MKHVQDETTIVRAARPTEAALLSELALRSKGYWGYDAEFLAACRDDLTIAAEYFDRARTFVVELAGEVGGFYALLPRDSVTVDLDFLYVDPTLVGSGLGKRLWQHTLETARAAGFVRMYIAADPHAEPFYSHMGAQRIGEVPSGAIPGRLLPHLVVHLRDHSALQLLRADGPRRIPQQDLRRILAYAVGTTDAQMDQLINGFYAHAPRQLFALIEADVVVGVVGIERAPGRRAVITHIAVDVPERGRGLGRYMIERVAQAEDLHELEAETDREAVTFYRRCGFTVVSLGEKYPGVERFSCHYRR